jgi:hypothetical protein
MADLPEHETSLNTYQAITAATTAELIGLDFAAIMATLRKKTHNLVKIELTATKHVVDINHQLVVMTHQRDELRKFADSMVLAQTEIKNAPTKNITEEQSHERENNLRILGKQLIELNKLLVHLDERLSYFYDINEDNQMHYRAKIIKSLTTISELNHKLTNIMMAAIKKLEINVEHPDIFTKEVQKLLNHPDIQAAFIAAASGQPGKGLTQKLKELFR